MLSLLRRVVTTVGVRLSISPLVRLHVFESRFLISTRGTFLALICSSHSVIRWFSASTEYLVIVYGATSVPMQISPVCMRSCTFFFSQSTVGYMGKLDPLGSFFLHRLADRKGLCAVIAAGSCVLARTLLFAHYWQPQCHTAVPGKTS